MPDEDPNWLTFFAGEATPTNGQINLPGWNDVVHLVPDSALSREQQIARKRVRARNIAQSQSTPLSKSVTWLMTQIDNIQDGLVTLAVAGRLTALAIPKIRPAVELVGRAADALNIGQIFTAFRKAPTSAKRGLEGAMKSSPRYYQGRVKGATTLAKALPNLAESLQILQTSDQLTGVGISLGAIMGAPLAAVTDLITGKNAPPLSSWQELAALPEQERLDRARTEALSAEPAARQRFEAYALATAVSVASPPTLITSVITETLGRAWEAVTPYLPELPDVSKEVMEAGEWLGVGGQDLSHEDHLMISIAYSMALDVFNRFPLQLPSAAFAPVYLDIPLTTRPPSNPTTRLALIAEGIDPDAPAPFPLHGSPLVTTQRDAIAEISAIAPGRVTHWRDRLPTEDLRQFAGNLHTHQARAPWPILEGPHIEMQHGYIPQGRAANAMLAMGILPPTDFPDELLWQLLSDLGSLWFAQDTEHPHYERAIADVRTAAARILRERA